MAGVLLQQSTQVSWADTTVVVTRCESVLGLCDQFMVLTW